MVAISVFESWAAAQHSSHTHFSWKFEANIQVKSLHRG
jgi:hypothetical protein